MKFADKVVELTQPGYVTYSALIWRVIFMIPWKSGIFDKHGVRLNVLGRRELLPPSVQTAVEVAERVTRHNNTCVYRFFALYSFPHQA